MQREKNEDTLKMKLTNAFVRQLTNSRRSLMLLMYSLMGMNVLKGLQIIHLRSGHHLLLNLQLIVARHWPNYLEIERKLLIIDERLQKFNKN